MKMNNLFLTMLAIVLFSFSSNAQQWTGPSNASSEIYRTGRVGIGLVNPPNDTQLYIKSNLKAGIVSEVSHTADWKFGILSAVDRANTKALSVIMIHL